MSELIAFLNSVSMGFFDTFFTIIFAAISIAALGIAMVVSVFTILLANIQIWIGFALGPFLLAFTIMEQFRSMLSSWISFILGGMFLKIVATAIVWLFTGMITAISTANLSYQGLTLVPYLIISLLCFGMIMCLKQAGSLASGLTGGFAMSGPHAGSVMGVAGKMVGTSLMGGKAAATVAKAGIGGAAGAATGMVLGGMKGAGVGSTLAAAMGATSGPISKSMGGLGAIAGAVTGAAKGAVSPGATMSPVIDAAKQAGSQAVGKKAASISVAAEMNKTMAKM